MSGKLFSLFCIWLRPRESNWCDANNMTASWANQTSHSGIWFSSWRHVPGIYVKGWSSKHNKSSSAALSHPSPPCSSKLPKASSPHICSNIFSTLLGLVLINFYFSIAFYSVICLFATWFVVWFEYREHVLNMVSMLEQASLENSPCQTTNHVDQSQRSSTQMTSSSSLTPERIAAIHETVSALLSCMLIASPIPTTGARKFRRKIFRRKIFRRKIFRRRIFRRKEISP